MDRHKYLFPGKKNIYIYKVSIAKEDEKVIE